MDVNTAACCVLQMALVQVAVHNISILCSERACGRVGMEVLGRSRDVRDCRLFGERRTDHCNLSLIGHGNVSLSSQFVETGFKSAPEAL